MSVSPICQTKTRVNRTVRIPHVTYAPHTAQEPVKTRDGRTPAILGADISVERLQSEVDAYLRACSRNESLLTEEDLKDISADVLAAIWPRKSELEHPLRYTRKVVRNHVIRFLRKKRRRLEVLAEWDGSGSESTVSASLPHSELSYGGSARPRQDFVRACVERQDGQTRLILHLRYEAGFSWRLIAEAVGGSAASVRMKEQRFCRRTLIAWESRRTD